MKDKATVREKAASGPLSLTLQFERARLKCQACDQTFTDEELETEAAGPNAGKEPPLRLWQEHNEIDRPTNVVVVLCKGCARLLVEPHPRLYRPLQRYEPWPGAMRICDDCPLRVALSCTSPAAKANGGAGVILTVTKPADVHCLYGGKDKHKSGWSRIWLSPAKACKQKNESLAQQQEKTKDD